MNIYVINLKKDKERLHQIDNYFSKYNLNYKRIDAIDGLQIKDNKFNFLEKYGYKLNLKRELKCGEIGAAKSHFKAWKEILENKDNYSLILEDDCIIPDNVCDILNLFEKNPSVDILNLSSTGLYNIEDDYLKNLIKNKIKKRPFIKNKKIWKNIEFKSHKIFNIHKFGQSFILECSTMPPLANAYIINKKACKCLLKSKKFMFWPIDNHWRYISYNLRYGFINTVFFNQDKSFESTIGNRDIKINLSFLEKLLRNLLKIYKLRNEIRMFKLYGLRSKL